jgi:hypothetical protein
MRGTAFCVCLLLLLLWATAAADSVVLKSGTTVSGTIVGRDSISAGEDWPSTLMIVSETSGETLEFPLADVECLIIGGSDGPQIIHPPSDWRIGGSPKHSRGRVLLVGSGIAVSVVAAVVPFGGERLVRTATGDFVREVRYNEVNYALLGAGLAMVVAGALIDDSESGESLSSAPLIEPGLSPISGEPAIACCLRF